MFTTLLARTSSVRWLPFTCAIVGMRNFWLEIKEQLGENHFGN